MDNRLTVGKLREMIENIPDDYTVGLSSDTGVDQGNGLIIVEDVIISHGDREVAIYVNDVDPDDLEDEDYY